MNNIKTVSVLNKLYKISILGIYDKELIYKNSLC